jgi:hypothetical protein
MIICAQVQYASTETTVLQTLLQTCAFGPTIRAAVCFGKVVFSFQQSSGEVR